MKQTFVNDILLIEKHKDLMKKINKNKLNVM